MNSNKVYNLDKNDIELLIHCVNLKEQEYLRRVRAAAKFNESSSNSSKKFFEEDVIPSRELYNNKYKKYSKLKYKLVEILTYMENNEKELKP